MNSIGFKVGDKVECLAFGKGEVKMILNPMLHHITGVALIDNPVIVEFSEGIKEYTLDGKLAKWGRTVLRKSIESQPTESDFMWSY
jgi:hypothetical protein